MPFTAWKHTERNRQRKKKYVLISGGFVIPAVQNKSDSTQHSLEPTQILFKRPYFRGETGGWVVWAIAHPYFGRIEGTTGQWGRAVLLLAYPDFGSYLCPCQFPYHEFSVFPSKSYHSTYSVAFLWETQLQVLYLSGRSKGI